jgi:SAM-dependent methyltransferase
MPTDPALPSTTTPTSRASSSPRRRGTARRARRSAAAPWTATTSRVSSCGTATFAAGCWRWAKTYSRRFGGTNVAHVDVLHGSAANRDATIVADLADAPHIPDESFDCIILTQTLQYLYRPDAAVATLHRILRPGGVLLMTVPGITQISVHYEWPWYWSFTSIPVQRLLGEAFKPERVQCESHGKVLTAASHLYGVSASELTPAELQHVDPNYQVVITARAVRGA